LDHSGVAGASFLICRSYEIHHYAVAALLVILLASSRRRLARFDKEN